MVVVYLQLVAEMEPVIQQKSVVIGVEMQVVNVLEGTEFAVFVSSNKFLEPQNVVIWENAINHMTHLIILTTFLSLKLKYHVEAHLQKIAHILYQLVEKLGHVESKYVLAVMIFVKCV